MHKFSDSNQEESHQLNSELSMMSINQSLTKYLNFYLGKRKLGFAIMIDGPWGVGKTYFVKGFMSNRKKDEPKDAEFVYISLNGVHSDDGHTDRLGKIEG